MLPLHHLMSQAFHSTQMFAFLLCPVGPSAIPLSHWPVPRSLCKLDDGRGLFLRVRFDVTGRVAADGMVGGVEVVVCVCRGCFKNENIKHMKK